MWRSYNAAAVTITAKGITRRAALAGLMVLPVVSGCGSAERPNSSGGPPVTTAIAGRPASGFTAAVGELEQRYGADIGVYAKDISTGTVLMHRADQRFMMCSVFKGIACAAVLRRSQDDPSLLTRTVAIPPAEQILDHSPYTVIQASGTATYGQLCQAVVTVSDNTAANLLLDLLGGPSAVTAFARALGDDVTRLDRREMELNHGSAEDLLDTTTPEAIAATYEKLLLGDVLSNENRQKLVGWLTSNVVSAGRIRSGLPASWTVADKIGTGVQGERNDVGVAFPDGNRKPVVMGILTVTHDPTAAREQLVADVAAAIKTGLGL